MSKTTKDNKVFVGMSGGVDSSVAALLLKEAGYDVTGVFMRCFNVDGCAERDAEDARRVADKLDIPFYTFDFEEEYKQEVVEYMVDAYERGITPNPDVMCNKKVKFGIFLKKAKELGADYVATGHYVKIDRGGDFIKLFSGDDKNKDQSYFLWKLTQDQLKSCLFPLGDYKKPAVREIAKKHNLPTADKPDSQGICFLGQVSLQEFLSDYIDEQPGPIMDENGNEIGKHKGAWFYTIGQRRLGVDYNPKTSGEDPKPHYVAEKNVKSNTLVMAEGKNNPALYEEKILLRDLNFINPNFRKRLEKEAQTVQARIRYRQPLSSAVISMENDRVIIEFKDSQKFVSAGQSTVFYSEGGEVLGGGVIVQ